MDKGRAQKALPFFFPFCDNLPHLCRIGVLNRLVVLLAVFDFYSEHEYPVSDDTFFRRFFGSGTNR
jgi:hypothetical protein